MFDDWLNHVRRRLAPPRISFVDRGTALDRVVEAPPGDDDSDRVIAGVEFTSKLARALLGYGLPIHRLNQALLRLARALGFEAAFFLTPTGMIATFVIGGERFTQVLLAVPGAADMARLSGLHALVGRVERGEISPGEASKRVDAILAAKPRYGPVLTTFATALLSVAVARLLDASGTEMTWAAVLGFGVAALGLAARRWFTLGRLLPVLASLLASIAAFGLAADHVPVRPTVLVISAVISLLPGLTLTIGIIELATANLVSGTARLMGAMLTFFQLGFGIAIGGSLARWVPQLDWPSLPPLPEWADSVSTFLVSIAFLVLLRVRVRDSIGVLASCGLAMLGSRIGGPLLGVEVGAFLGALLVGLTSHLYARITDGPSLVLVVPGILALVPGVLGVLSLNSLIAEDTAVALQTAFQMFMVAIGISTGLLVATLALPPTRSL